GDSWPVTLQNHCRGQGGASSADDRLASPPDRAASPEAARSEPGGRSDNQPGWVHRLADRHSPLADRNSGSNGQPVKASSIRRPWLPEDERRADQAGATTPGEGGPSTGGGLPSGAGAAWARRGPPRGRSRRPPQGGAQDRGRPRLPASGEE